jgi:dual specificity MAP kinase phosphatase
MQVLSPIISYPNGATLFISGVQPYRDIPEYFFRNRIHTVISVVPEDEVPALPMPIQQHLFPLLDAPDEPIEQYFEPTFWIIAQALLRGESVLVHCRAGISRSVSIVIAFFLRTFAEGMSHIFTRPYIPRTKRTWTDSILLFIQRQRPYAQPNPGFMSQLYAYENECLGKNGVV